MQGAEKYWAEQRLNEADELPEAVEVAFAFYHVCCDVV